jgi:Ca2+-transporting ATPase
MTLAFAQVVHVFSSRSETRSAFDARLFENHWLWGAVALCVLLQMGAVYVPFLRSVLHTVPLGTGDWGVVAACALSPLAVVEVVKAIQRTRAG